MGHGYSNEGTGQGRGYLGNMTTMSDGKLAARKQDERMFGSSPAGSDHRLEERANW